MLGAVKKSPKLIGQLSSPSPLFLGAGVSPPLVQFVQISRYTEPESDLNTIQRNKLPGSTVLLQLQKQENLSIPGKSTVY